MLDKKAIHLEFMKAALQESIRAIMSENDAPRTTIRELAEKYGLTQSQYHAELAVQIATPP